MISHSSQRSRPYIVDGTLPLDNLEISMVDIFYFVITPGKFNFFFSREKTRLGKAVPFSYEEDTISPFLLITFFFFFFCTKCEKVGITMDQICFNVLSLLTYLKALYF